MTGAPIPAGADSVVPFEESDEARRPSSALSAKSVESVGIFAGVARRKHPQRRRGHPSRRNRPARRTEAAGRAGGVLACLAAPASFIAALVVAIPATGDELLDLGRPLEPGRIYDANSYSIAAMVSEAGGIPLRLGIAPDTIEDLTAKVHEALEADLLVTSAGVSRGDFDVVKDVLLREGEIDFWTVRMRPGKPLAFGSFPSGSRRVPHIGLPGNPVSSMVTFELFGRPAIYKMMGRSGWERPLLRVEVEDRVVNSDGRRFGPPLSSASAKAAIRRLLTGPQGSGILTSMALANALVVCPEEIAALEPGDEADALMLGPVLRDSP
jgi:molybdopterin molybdotransferase